MAMLNNQRVIVLGPSPLVSHHRTSQTPQERALLELPRQGGNEHEGEITPNSMAIVIRKTHGLYNAVCFWYPVFRQTLVQVE